MAPPSAPVPPPALSGMLRAPTHLGEADHLDRDHGFQEPGRGEGRGEQMRAEAALCHEVLESLILTHLAN